VVIKSPEPRPPIVIGLESQPLLQPLPQEQLAPAARSPVSRPIPSAATLRFRPSSVTLKAPASTAQHKVVPTAAPVPDKFVDPAILSYARTSVASPDVTPPYPTSTPSAPPMTSHAMPVAPAALLPTVEATLKHGFKREPSKTYEYMVYDNNTHEIDEEAVTVIPANSRPESQANIQEGHKAGSLGNKKTRARQKRKTDQQNDTLPDMPTSSPELSRMNVNVNGWRETPILQATSNMEDVAKTSEPRSKKAEHGTIKGKQGKKSRQRDRAKMEAQSGWATEDATDVQGMQEFDFAQNLAEFDKKAVFRQLADEDETAAEDRLVHFNRLPRPGTFGGTKIHPTENVLDNPGDEAHQDSEDDAYEALAASQISIRSRASLSRGPSSRKGSRLEGYTSPPSALTSFSRVHRVTSAANLKSPAHVSFDSDSVIGSSVPSLPLPRLTYTNSTRPCPTLQPTTLTAIESLAATAFASPLDLLIETSGHAIATIALKAINPTGQRLNPANHNTRPVIVVLCGPHPDGARALAAARHLAERGVRIIITSPASRAIIAESPLALQAQRLGGGRDIIRSWKDTAAYLKTLDAPPELIVDGLSSRHDSPYSSVRTLDANPSVGEDVLTSEIAVALEITRWANASAASVLAIDRPSGVDAVTGKVGVWEGEPVEVRAKIVVACGAPGIGLVRAMRMRSENSMGGDWRVFCVDGGLGPAGRAWWAAQSQAGAAREKWVRFAGEWSVEVELERVDSAMGGVGEVGLGLEGRRSSMRKSAGGDVYDAYE
jgi:enhancer of mRNA-decapping protein 3